MAAGLGHQVGNFTSWNATFCFVQSIQILGGCNKRWLSVHLGQKPIVLPWPGIQERPTISIKGRKDLFFCDRVFRQTFLAGSAGRKSNICEPGGGSLHGRCQVLDVKVTSTAEIVTRNFEFSPVFIAHHYHVPDQQIKREQLGGD